MGGIECIPPSHSAAELEDTELPNRGTQSCLCSFYDIADEDKLLTELKVFHSSYSCPPPVTVASVLSVVEDSADDIFSCFSELMTTYGTLPVSTATGERSFSKLKLVKTKR